MMNRTKLKATLFDIGKDIFIAFIVVCIVMLALFAYCRIWPPMVVVESGSMQRYDNRSVVGVIDTGDMVFVKKISGAQDIVTYVDGEANGHSTYGNYGDVIIYRPNGMTEYADGSIVVPIIHRPVVWIEVNTSRVSQAASGIDYANYTFDIPSLGLFGTTENIVLEDYGFWRQTVTIRLGMETGLLKYYEMKGKEPHGGYITMGDHNTPSYDQPFFGSYEPVLPEWIVGKAFGEIPWFGLVKLKVTGANLSGVPGNSWTGLILTLVAILLLPFAFDILYPRIKKRFKKEDEPAEPALDAGNKDDLPDNGPPPDAKDSQINNETHSKESNTLE